MSRKPEDSSSREAEDADEFAIVRYLDPGCDPIVRAKVEERAGTDPEFGQKLREAVIAFACARDIFAGLYGIDPRG